MKNYITLLLLLVLIATTAKSQVWESCNNGIGGEIVTSLAVKDQNVYAGTKKGRLYMSSDNGENWKFLYSAESAVHSIILIERKVYIGTKTKGVFLSEDEGQSWALQNDSIPFSYMRGLKVAGMNIFAFCINIKGADVNPIIFASSDEGVSWKEVLAGEEYYSITCFEALGSNLFVGTSLGDIYLLTDVGVNWTKLGTSFTDMSISILKARGKELLAGSKDGKFFISKDNGLSWTSANKGLPDVGISVIAYSGDKLFVGTDGEGIYISTDNAANWNNFTDTLYTKHVPENCLVTNGNFLFTSCGAFGVYRKDLSTLSIEDGRKANHKYELYPNPAQDYINIKISEKEEFSEYCKIEIFSTLGTKVWQSSIDTRTINISSFVKGVYFLKIDNKVYKFEKI